MVWPLKSTFFCGILYILEILKERLAKKSFFSGKSVFPDGERVLVLPVGVPLLPLLHPQPPPLQHHEPQVQKGKYHSKLNNKSRIYTTYRNFKFNLVICWTQRRSFNFFTFLTVILNFRFKGKTIEMGWGWSVNIAKNTNKLSTSHSISINNVKVFN